LVKSFIVGINKGKTAMRCIFSTKYDCVISGIEIKHIQTSHTPISEHYNQIARSSSSAALCSPDLLIAIIFSAVRETHANEYDFFVIH
jgi:hypothetical protein